MISRLIVNGIIRSFSMRQRRIGAAVMPPIGIISNSDVCGGLLCLFCAFNDLISLRNKEGV